MAEDKDRIQKDVDEMNVTETVGSVIAGAAGVSLLGPLGAVAGATSTSVIVNTAGAVVEDLTGGVDLDREE